MSCQTSYDPVSMRWSLSDGNHYLELPEWARELLADEHERETKMLRDRLRRQTEECVEAEAENAKLRELLQRLLTEYRYMRIRPRRVYLQHEGRMRVIEEEMRELGVEVNDG